MGSTPIRTRTTAALAAAALVATLAQALPASARPVNRKPPATQVTASVEGRDITADPAPTDAPVSEPPATAWPAPGKARVDLRGTPPGQATRAGNTPLRVAVADTPAAAAAPAGADVEVLDRAAAARAGVDGLLVKITPTGSAGPDRPLELTVEFAAFADAMGGDWASRLRLVRLPQCALTARRDTDCPAGEPLPTSLDPDEKTATAVLAAPTTQATSFGTGSTSVVALTAAPSGGAGTYTATPLGPASSWQASPQTGDFTWTYPLAAPPAVGGPAPELAVAYSSGSVDGRVASTNNQASWVGEGHDLVGGYIERKYLPCGEDLTGANTTTKTGDLCWGSENASLVLDGRSTEIVRDAGTGAWRLKDDDASRIEKLTGAPNGDNDGEHWRLTTTDGTQYYFGLTKRYAADTANTESAWTVPVFGNQAGEPCYQASFAASSCAQAWRWNLDYVVDARANTATYFYAAETNRYGRNLNTAVSSYVRGGHLTRIEYGQRQGAEHTTATPARVMFTVAERCLPSGSITCDPAQLTAANASYWPDVPFDQICDSTTSCPNRVAPTFFTRKRLTGVTTGTWNGTGYTTVDSWEFTQEFRDPGDGTSKHLWLAAIQRTGHAGGTPVTTPPVTFVGVQLANRVDGLDTAPPLIKWRISSVNTETGATISVNYTGPECVAGSNVPAAPESNTKRCFPVYYTPEGASEPSLHYFHKYLVDSVVEDDRTGGGLSKITRYGYVGAPAWHYDDTPLVPAKYRTWGQWRGYGTVDVTVGNGPAAQRLHTRYLFLRGMDDDVLPGGGRRQVVVTDSRGGTVEDHPALNGFLREQTTYDGQGGPVVDTTIHDPWISATTANNGTSQAWLTDVAATATHTTLAAGGVRTTRTVTGYDSHGLPTSEEDLGDVAEAADDTCTRTTYAKNTTAWILETPNRVETVARNCATTPARPGDVVEDVRYYYDGAASHTSAPVRGDLTRTETLTDAPTGATYQTTARASYDVHGRVLEVYDGLDRKTSTAYTPAVGGPVTGVTVTNALGHTTTTTLDPARGLPTVQSDANGKRTEAAYDALGRLAAVWLPGRSRAAGASANQAYEYQVRADGPTTVAAKELRNDGTYSTAYSLFDGLLRPRQTQAPAPGGNGGRILTDTVYDDRGLPVDANGPYYNSAAPGTALLWVPDNQMPTQTRTSYDGAGRATVAAFRSYDVEQWRTTTSYGGDRLHVDPPDGGTATTSVLDARGRVVALRQYTGGAPAGAYDETRYGYDAAGRRTTITDAAGNTWRTTYDLRGRTVRTEDPDRGTTTHTYDAADQLVTTTDARGQSLAYTYDLLGRKTSLREDGPTGVQRAEWTYDTLAKGQPSAATRFAGGAAYTHAVTGYDDRYRPTSATVTIPAVEGALAGTYTTLNAYNLDGGLRAQRQPTVPGLAGETLTYGYDALGLPATVSGNGSYVAGTIRSPYGEVLQHDLGTTVGKAVWATYFYQDGTRRLARQLLDRQNVATTDADVDYTWDPAGNLTRLADTPAGGAADVQCFGYDYLRRLTVAWTATDGCAAGPSLAVLGTTAPYWTSWTYDAVGNRLTQTQHAAAGDTVSAYAYPAPGQPRPHAVTAVTTTAPGATPTTAGYGYDAVGNATSRSGQTLTWDAEGELAAVTAAAKTTSFLYDAGGERLIRREPGATTLYLGNTEVRLDTATGTATSTRYYTLDGRTVAVRTSAGVQMLAADHHGTAQHAVTAATGTLTSRRFTPFGAARGTPPASWPGQRGFVGGVTDPTGLTLLGARYYDPHLGAFTSVDPILDPADPQQMHGYAYANNNPASMTDPDGLIVQQGYDGYDAPTLKKKYGITDRSRMGLPAGSTLGKQKTTPTYTASKRIRTAPTNCTSRTCAYQGLTASKTRSAWQNSGSPRDAANAVGGFATSFLWLIDPDTAMQAPTLLGLDQSSDAFVAGSYASVLVPQARAGSGLRATVTSGAAKGGGALVKYDADFAIGQLTQGGRGTASGLVDLAESQGWKAGRRKGRRMGL